ncbi:MAG: AAA family ATPase [Candidatus Marinimicrobia bacterium]|nr:AAA family ATPase [Candidatus Neomarinimicrobiota bacterium]
MDKHNVHTTFSPKLDAILGGGIPKQSLNILAGHPGAGKSIFAHHLLFHHLKRQPQSKVLYLTTLSEPPAKIIRYMRDFSFFQSDLFQTRFQLDDIGPTIREKKFGEISDKILEIVQQYRPDILVIDSFKAIRDIGGQVDEFRQFVYQVAVRLYGQQCTTFLVGEYDISEISQGAEFAVADGIILLEMRQVAGEPQRLLQVRKLRGQNPVTAPLPFYIDTDGIQIQYLTTVADSEDKAEEQIRSTGITAFDELVDGGLASGQTLLISGVSGTGKTTLALQILHNALQRGDTGLYYSFEESRRALLRTATHFGWSFEQAIAEDRGHFFYIPQTAIRIEEVISRLEQEIERYQPQWLIMDSFSVYLHRVEEPAIIREKMYQIRSLLQHHDVTGLLISDIPAHATTQLSRAGVEETVADGTIVLRSNLEHNNRCRYLEVYKMRRINHVKGMHRMIIGENGIEVFYTSGWMETPDSEGTTFTFTPLQSRIENPLRYNSAWLIRGEAGMGKSTMAMNFVAEGLQNQESVLLITADAPEQDTVRRLSTVGVDVEPYLHSGQLKLLDAYSGNNPQLNLSDPEVLKYYIFSCVSQMQTPIRVVFDSITPLSVRNNLEGFVELIHQKNRMLRHPQVTVLDTHLYQRNAGEESLALLNGYDIVIDLYATGEVTANAKRQFQITKARDIKADSTPQSFEIDPARGIVPVDH